MLHALLENQLRAAVTAVLPDADTTSILVRPCPDPKFGDYQTNALMSVAKERKLNPRQLATEVVAKLDVSQWCETVEIAGAGFLNFRLKADAIVQTLQAAFRGEHLFFTKSAAPRTIVIDFSSPNVAKPMHVGHIRSTGIGDALQRVLRLLGHHVITDNHIGDWGTQFGKLLVGWKNLLDQKRISIAPLEELEFFYKAVNFVCEEFDSIRITAANQCLAEFDCPEEMGRQSDVLEEWKALQAKWRASEPKKREALLDNWEEIFGAQTDRVNSAAKALTKYGLLDWDSPRMIAEGDFKRFKDFVGKAIRGDLAPTPIDSARTELVRLQAGDADNLAVWKEMIRLSQVQFDTIYGRLGVKFDHTLGESFYNPWLGNVVNDLLQRGIAKESEGAVGVFSDGSMPPKEDPFLVNRDGEWVADPALVRKSDGGFNYMTTDLATIEYRLKTWSPSEIIYVVDDRQAPHFRKLFLTFGRWQPDATKCVKLRHVGFGKILGDDGKPFKTRSGDTVKLGDLLDEAVERALKVVAEKNPDLSEVQQREIARVVGIGAVKYADLLPNRQSDYVFSWDKMLAMNGNTAPYLQYAYARIRSIFRKANEAGDWRAAMSHIQLNVPEEIGMARHLLNFGLALEAVGDECRPNFLCNYLYELSGYFATFYEACPVLKAEGAERATRLLLCELTARVLKQGLEALGIDVLEQM